MTSSILVSQSIDILSDLARYRKIEDTTASVRARQFAIKQQNRCSENLHRHYDLMTETELVEITKFYTAWCGQNLEVN